VGRHSRCRNSGKTSMPDDAAKVVQVEFTPEFKRNTRQLAKKYRHLQADVQPVIDELEAGQTPGATNTKNRLYGLQSPY
jgi:hypothetical protein